MGTCSASRGGQEHTTLKRLETQVAIIGAGPSGLLLGQLLARSGIDNIVIERVTGDYVLGRIRAGILERGFVNLVREAGAADRLDSEGELHEGFSIAVGDELTRVDMKGLTGGEVVVCYGQVDITRNLMDARSRSGMTTLYEAVDALHKALRAAYGSGELTSLQRYSEVALRRVWHGVRFSWWMTDMLHSLDGLAAEGLDGETHSRLMDSRLDYYLGTKAGRRVIAEQYVGLPYESPSG